MKAGADLHDAGACPLVHWLTIVQMQRVNCLAVRNKCFGAPHATQVVVKK